VAPAVYVGISKYIKPYREKLTILSNIKMEVIGIGNQN
jgi:hypothetical protein